jgi:RND family efflux transporter MFP subunit
MRIPRPKALLPLLAVACGAAVFGLCVAFPERTDREPPPVAAPLVRVIPVAPTSLQLRISTHGTVEPRTESELVAEVAGPVVWISPALASGGFFEAGEALLRIDPRDPRAALERARANLERRRSEFSRATRELARQRELRGRDAASASRLDDAETNERVAAAGLREAEAALGQAERDVERCEIRAPFTGRVREERVDVGQFVSRGERIARVYAIDFAEVRLPVSDDELAFVDLPLLYRGDAPDTPGPEVELSARFAGERHAWRARVVRTEGEIDPRTRMVNVVARVENPYERSDGRPPLAVGLFVDAEILGRRVEGVTVLPRAALREGDVVHVVDAEDRLRLRAVEVLRRHRDEVVLTGGLAPGERVSLTPLAAPVEGMLVKPVALEETGP